MSSATHRGPFGDQYREPDSPDDFADLMDSLYQPGGPLCGCDDCECIRQEVGVEELTDDIRVASLVRTVTTSE